MKNILIWLIIVSKQTSSYFALSSTITCLACWGWISMPGANKELWSNISSMDKDLFCWWLPLSSDSQQILSANWTENWGSSLTDEQDWNVCTLSPLLLLGKLRFQDKWIKEANFLENWTGAVRWNPNKGECLQAKQTASKGFINSSRQPLTHYYWKPWISSRQVIGIKRNIWGIVSGHNTKFSRQTSEELHSRQ